MVTYLKESELFFVLNRSIVLSLEFPLDAAEIGDISAGLVIGGKLVRSFVSLANLSVGLEVSEASKLGLVLHGVELALVEIVLHEVLVPLEHVFESSELGHFFLLEFVIINQKFDFLVKIYCQFHV